MLTVDHYGRIRGAYRDGMSICEIARRFHHSRRKVREFSRGTVSRSRIPERKDQHYRKLGEYRWLRSTRFSRQTSKRRRSNATRRCGSSSGCKPRGIRAATTRCDVTWRKRRKRQRETFIPLIHDPGQRVEADFGQIYVDFPEGRRAVSVLILVWSHSNYPFAMALPTQRTRSDSRRDGSRLRVLRLRAARGLVGQPQDGGHWNC